MTDPREPIGTYTVGDWKFTEPGRTEWRCDQSPDPLTVPEPYATVDEGNPGMVIVWMLGAIIAALIVAVAWLAWTR